MYKANVRHSTSDDSGNTGGLFCFFSTLGEATDWVAVVGYPNMISATITREKDADTQALLLEGLAAQMRSADKGSSILWWHQISEEERERYRKKARSHIDQVGWE